MRVDHTGAPNAVTGFHKISRSGFGFGIRTETQFQIRTIEDSSAFNQMEQEWNALLESSAADNLFLSWDWLNLWWRHLGKDRRLHVVEIRSNGTLVALLPLCIVSERLEFLGTGSVGSDYLDFIVHPDHQAVARAAIVRALRETGRIMRFAQLRADAAVTSVASRLAEDGYHIVERTTGVCPYVSLDGLTWNEFLSSLGQSHRENVRRRIRHLEKRGAFFEVTKTEADRRRNLRILFELHARCWEDRGGSDGLHTEELISFHEEFSRIALERGWLRLFVLHVDGRPVAAVYGFLRNGKFYFYQSGFEPAFRSSSVGLVALALTIRQAIEEKAPEFDFLHGNEEYKFRWARETRDLKCIEFYPQTLAGSFAMQWNQAARATRRMARYVIPRWR
jgi:CelD/BcsL family acetyltransferase involved in cellulose biosynthesis